MSEASRTTDPSVVQEGPDRLISSAEAASMLGIKIGTLYQWTSSKKVSFVRLGRNLIKFRLADIRALILAHYVPAIRDGSEGQQAG